MTRAGDAPVILDDAPRLTAIQAAIAAEHARAMSPGETNSNRIADLYSILVGRPDPVVEPNRAVAVAKANGLKIIYEIETRGELNDYYLMWSARI